MSNSLEMAIESKSSIKYLFGFWFISSFIKFLNFFDKIRIIKVYTCRKNHIQAAMPMGFNSYFHILLTSFDSLKCFYTIGVFMEILLLLCTNLWFINWSADGPLHWLQSILGYVSTTQVLLPSFSQHGLHTILLHPTWWRYLYFGHIRKNHISAPLMQTKQHLVRYCCNILQNLIVQFWTLPKRSSFFL